MARTVIRVPSSGLRALALLPQDVSWRFEHVGDGKRLTDLQRLAAELGLAERIRSAGLESTPFASLGRGVAGIRERTLIVNLPGSPSGVGDGLAILADVVDHAADLLRGETCHGPGAE